MKTSDKARKATAEPNASTDSGLAGLVVQLNDRIALLEQKLAERIDLGVVNARELNVLDAEGRKRIRFLAGSNGAAHAYLAGPEAGGGSVDLIVNRFGHPAVLLSDGASPRIELRVGGAVDLQPKEDDGTAEARIAVRSNCGIVDIEAWNSNPAANDGKGRLAVGLSPKGEEFTSAFQWGWTW
jgi:hypothetical protein